MAALLMCVALQDAVDLVKRLGDEDPDVRDAATQKLIELGEAALPALREAPDDPEVRARAAKLIERIEWPAMTALEAELARLNESGKRKYELVEKSDVEFRRAFPEIRVFHLPVTWQAPELSSIFVAPTYFVWRMEPGLIADTEITKKKSIVLKSAEEATLLVRAMVHFDKLPPMRARDGGFESVGPISHVLQFRVQIDVDESGVVTKIWLD